MNSKTINWGIIGAGKIASKFAEDLNDSESSNLYAIASRNLDKAKDFRLQFNADVAYGSYQDLVIDPNIDAIYIATPHSFHKEHTLLCLNNKKPVLCEKPFAINFEEVNTMILAAKKSNTLLMEALWTAFLPHFQYVQDLLKKEHFGKIVQLEADFGFHPQYDETSRLFDKSVGGGSLLDIGIYPVFAALSTLGQPNEIEADAEFYSSGADSECHILFHYDTAKAVLKSTFLEETKTEAIWTCEHGTIKINSRFHEANSIELIDKLGNSTTKLFNRNTIGYSYEIEHFNELIRIGQTESNIMTFKHSQDLIKILDLIRLEIGLEYK
ncbi:Gfo/Idh/MocA family protein [Winogradskyella sp. PE311]|uniref:Gfo/Idh/MocA family protein n=1 Tax=Winogradskyella sp. PE311 TaxID=3366943 RepID=UPI00397EF53C